MDLQCFENVCIDCRTENNLIEQSAVLNLYSANYPDIDLSGD